MGCEDKTMNEKSGVRASMTDGRDADWLAFIEGSIIGTFTVGADAGGKREGLTDGGRKLWVYVCAHARGIPHFHVYDKDGDPVENGGKGGVHACVGLRKSEYCTHGPRAGVLDQEARAGLDRFMQEVRTKGKHCCDVGKTNFFHTAAEWDDNNAPPGSRNWVDPETIQPGYGTIEDRRRGRRTRRGLP